MKNTLWFLFSSKMQLSLVHNDYAKFPHFKSADVSIIIRMWRLKSKGYTVIKKSQ